jgi:hypothetical protein
LLSHVVLSVVQVYDQEYETFCLLIRNTISCVSYSEEWELAWYFAQAHMVQEGPVRKTLALRVGPVGETVVKHDILL